MKKVINTLYFGYFYGDYKIKLLHIMLPTAYVKNYDGQTKC